MRYPSLVLEKYCKTPIRVELDQEGISEFGAPLKALEADLMCNYQDSAKKILTPQQQLVEISGKALFPGDICPDLPVISGGRVVVYGVERDIYDGKKNRNPDGTVNFTELRLI